MVLHDELGAIVENLRRVAVGRRVVVISGGLGPTDDDLTREAVAQAFDLKLDFDEGLWQDIQAYFVSRGKVAGPANRSQALRVAGSEALKNPVGTAPGLRLRRGETEIIAFPGVPSEFKRMCADHFLTRHPENRPEPVPLRLQGIGESDLMQRVRELDLIPKDFEWGTMARRDGLWLRFTQRSLAHPACAEILGRLRGTFAKYIYAENEQPLVQIFAGRLLALGKSVVCAESCTGGLLSQWLTALPGSSAFFRGAVVAYHNDIKQSQLEVPASLLGREGAVSEACARAMAEGVARRLQCPLAISLTGIAGPDGGTSDKPVGTVFVATACAGKTVARRFLLHGDRDEVRERAAHQACLMGLAALNG